MIRVAFSTLLIVSAFQLKGQEISEIKLTFHHSLRIPFNSVELDAIHYNDKFLLVVKVVPMNNHPKWNKANIDTVYTISSKEFETLKSMVVNIKTSDLVKSMIGLADDGTFWNLSFGDFGSKITYNVLSIDHNTKKRGLTDFVAACEYMMELGRLKFRKIR